MVSMKLVTAYPKLGRHIHRCSLRRGIRSRWWDDGPTRCGSSCTCLR